MRRPLLGYFLLTFGLTWLGWLPFILSADGLGVFPWHVPVVLGSAQTIGMIPGALAGPIGSAALVTWRAEGRAGLARWAARLVRFRVSPLGYAGIVLAVPAAVIAATLLLPDGLPGVRLPSGAVLAAYLPMLILQFFTTGLIEEPGWRDFAQPRLQERFGPLTGSLVLGPLWGAWHLPLFFTAWAGWPDVDWSEPVEFVVATVLLSIVLTWVFNRSGGSLPMVMLTHAGVNNASSVLWPAMFPRLDPFRDSLHAVTIAAAVTALVLIVTTRGRLGAPGPQPLPHFLGRARRAPSAAIAPCQGCSIKSKP